jgi:hypothetical protein
MNSNRTFWRRGFSLTLVIAFNLMSLYALACPILCAPRDCAHAMEASAMAGMPSCRKKCCPAHHSHSNENQGVRCGTPANSCISHIQQPTFLIPAGPAAVQYQPVLVITPGLHILSLAQAISFFVPQSPYPPGFLTGREICQSQSLLRI